MGAIYPRNYEHLSPFEITDELIRLARTLARTTMHAYHAAQRAGTTPAVPEPACPKEAMQ